MFESILPYPARLFKSICLRLLDFASTKTIVSGEYIQCEDVLEMVWKRGPLACVHFADDRGNTTEIYFGPARLFQACFEIASGTMVLTLLGKIYDEAGEICVHCGDELLYHANDLSCPEPANFEDFEPGENPCATCPGIHCAACVVCHPVDEDEDCV